MYIEAAISLEPIVHLKSKSSSFAVALVLLLAISRNANADTVTFTARGDIEAKGSFTFFPDPDSREPVQAEINYLEFGGVTTIDACAGWSNSGEFIIGTECDGFVYNGPDNGFTLFIDSLQDPLANLFVATLASDPGNLLFDFDVDVTYTAGSGSGITPEPSTFALLGTGLLGIAGMLKRRLV